jgi:iron complex transport system substrate-binding protein
MRIISLLASATEIVCALGLEKQLVGRSHECDFPKTILGLPQCTETKFDTSGNSLEIDQRLKQNLRDGLSIYRVFNQMLEELKPDLLITQMQCEVCAVSEKDVNDALCSWIGYRPQVVSLNPNSLEDIWQDIQKIATAVQQPKLGQNLIASLQNRLNDIHGATKARTRPRVACIEWIEPLMAAGNWVPELVELAGGINLFGNAGKHSPWMQWQELVQADPDIIIVMPCGWDIQRASKDMHFLTQRLEWNHLRAVSQNKVFLTDGNQYFNRPGSRVVESLEILAEIFHPEQFTFGHEGRGWKRF